MVGVAEPKEIAWVKNYRKVREDFSGVIFEGTKNTEARMSAICGALIRNFIDARFVSLNNLLSKSDFDHEDATVLLVPNLYVLTHGGKPLTAWQIQHVYDLLLSRMTTGKQTLLYVENLESLGNDYGSVFQEHLSNNYQFV